MTITRRQVARDVLVASWRCFAIDAGNVARTLTKRPPQPLRPRQWLLWFVILALLTPLLALWLAFVALLAVERAIGGMFAYVLRPNGPAILEMHLEADR